MRRPSRRRARLASTRQGWILLLLGGASSGKSTVALRLAQQRPGRRAFVATAEALDPEMADRIARHRTARGEGWETAEVPVDVTGWLLAKGRGYHWIVLDCLTLWLANLRGRGVLDETVSREVSALIDAARRSRARVVVVSNELGMGLVPTDPDSRKFRELMGQVNQQIAAAADEVYVVTAGIPIRVK